MAAAHLEQARSQVTVARSYLYPEIDLGASAQRLKVPANRPLSAYSTPNQSTVQNDFVLGPGISYEFDLFGRVRREVEGYRAAADQAAADFENTRLMLTTQLVSDYFTLRELDSEIDVLNRSLDLERDALTFITSRHDLGYATGLDLAQQQALVQNSAAQLELLQVQRAQNEHAIATLLGTPAPGFSIAPLVTSGTLPVIPVGLPSDLLQRRPDVAAAERAMAAANARIGVARAAYFPTVQLLPAVPGFGLESTAISTLFSAPQPAVVVRPVRDSNSVQRRQDARQCAYRRGGLRRRRGQLPTDRPDGDGGRSRTASPDSLHWTGRPASRMPASTARSAPTILPTSATRAASPSISMCSPRNRHC